MLSFFSTVSDRLVELPEAQKGCWAHLTSPTQDELTLVSDKLGIQPDYLQAALDEEESARIETEDGQTLIIVDIPCVEPEQGGYVYSTLPVGIILTEDAIVTVTSRESAIIDDFTQERVKNFSTQKRTRFILQFLFRNASRFLGYLKQIDKASSQVQDSLNKSMKNRELIQMMRLEKSLVYFSTSLKGNEMVLEKMMRLPSIKKYPDDQDLLDDVIIENKQAIEMCAIYRDIMSGTMDAYASLISNNLNIVMKVLTSLTVVLSVPTIIASLWGMNVGGLPFSQSPWGFWAVAGISLLLAALAFLVMWKRKLF